MSLSAIESPSLRDQVSEAEWNARVDLAACYRLVARNGWDDLIYTHISARVPDEGHAYLINPLELHFHEITASSLVKVDPEGNTLSQTPYSTNPAGLVIHGAVHGAREDAGCVIHLHTVAGTAVATQKDGLLPITQAALLFYDNIAYHDYEGLAVDDAERDRLVADFGNKTAMMLRNHGTMVAAPTISKAYTSMYFLERACQMQIAAQAGGAELNMPSPESQKQVRRASAEAFSRSGTMEWPGLLRLLDHEDPSFRD
jgi:ribulose-5-phosphate 4-epimerase/fuculose-1-phosphate aldolase